MNETDLLLQIDDNGGKIQEQRTVSQRRIILSSITVACCLYAGFAYWFHLRRSRDFGTADKDALRFEPEDQDVARKYKATQFVSFTINTMGGREEYGECKHRHVDPELGTCYLGDYNITHDVHQRVAILEHVLGKLKQDNNGTRIDDDPRTLKIMMVPEVSLHLLLIDP